MSTATLARPMNLRPLPARVGEHDQILVVLDVTFATPGAVRVRVPGGRRSDLLAYSVAREVRPPAWAPAGTRAFTMPRWKHDQLMESLNEPETPEPE